jgi:hypothetical protein
MKPIAIRAGVLMMSVSTAALAQGAAQGQEGSGGARLTGPDYAGSQSYPKASPDTQGGNWAPGPLSENAKKNDPDAGPSTSAASQGAQSGPSRFSNQGGPNATTGNHASAEPSAATRSSDQSPSRQSLNDQSSDDMSARDRSGPGQASPESRFSQRSSLREELREAGFHDIRILDAMFLVRATTPSGRQVTIVVNPPDRNAPDAVSEWGGRWGNSGSGRSFSNDRSTPGSQFSQNGSSGSDRRSGYNPHANADQDFGLNRQFSTNQGFNQNRQPGTNQQSGANQSENTGSTSAQSSGPVRSPTVMDPDQVRAMLRQEGFSDISNLDRDGMTYTGTADLFGEEVDVRIDARTGLVLQPFALNPDQVATMLDRHGWNVREIQENGGNFAVLAQRNGRTVELQVDPTTGRTTRVDQNGGSANTSGTDSAQNR